jgi:FKBP-type peptidyl-prolyl cis-trans isomerase 2
MTNKLQKKDFIEIEFTGKIKDTGEIFDSNIKKDLEKLNPQHKPEQAKPFVFSLGQDMFLKGIDDFLIGKEIKEHKIDLSPEKGFGNRDAKLIKLMPRSVFIQQKTNPVPGMVFNFDNQIGKILSVSGGRIRVDFNNPLAGKDVVYDVKILRKIEDQNEKIKSFIEFVFRQPLKFEVKDKKIIIQAEKQMKQFIEMFKEKFKEVFEMDLEVEEVGDKKGSLNS